MISAKQLTTWGMEIDLKIIRIRNIIILQFVEHKHDVWWTISQFRPTFLLIYIAPESKRERRKSPTQLDGGMRRKKVISQQQDFSISHETSNFLYKMKSLRKYEKYDKQIGIFMYFTRRLYNKKIPGKMIITFTFLLLRLISWFPISFWLHSE